MSYFNTLGIVYKIFGVKHLNEDGYGNGAGDYICTVDEYEDIKEVMLENNLKQVFVETVNKYERHPEKVEPLWSVLYLKDLK